MRPFGKYFTGVREYILLTNQYTIASVVENLMGQSPRFTGTQTSGVAGFSTLLAKLRTSYLILVTWIVIR